MRRALSRSVWTWLTLATACGGAGPSPNGRAGDDAGKAPSPDASVATPTDPAADASAGGPPTPLDATADSSPVPGLKIDLAQTSVSGLSSGAFMAVQFGVAFSSIVEGIGVFAGGPFGCSQGSATIAQLQCQLATTSPDVTPMVAATKSLAASGAIDDLSHLAAIRVFLFGGADDTVVSPAVVDATQNYFAAFVTTAGSVQYVSRRAATGHRIPTLSYGAACDANDAPWIGNCGYDGAGAALAQIYGPLSPTAATPSGTIATLAQGDFVSDPASHSLGPTAYVYIPAACANGASCRIHVAFHGCSQEASGSVGSGFYLHAGYNEWADTNHIVVLYPQTIASLVNPYACWDWWGYDSPQFDTKTGPQMAMTRAMIAKLAGAGGEP